MDLQKIKIGQRFFLDYSKHLSRPLKLEAVKWGNESSLTLTMMRTGIDLKGGRRKSEMIF